MRGWKMDKKENELPPYEADETHRILGDGGEWVFPTECPHCQADLVAMDIEWIDSRKAECPNCKKMVFAYIRH
jgi:hypothetical protein